MWVTRSISRTTTIMNSQWNVCFHIIEFSLFSICFGIWNLFMIKQHIKVESQNHAHRVFNGKPLRDGSCYLSIRIRTKLDSNTHSCGSEFIKFCDGDL